MKRRILEIVVLAIIASLLGIGLYMAFGGIAFMINYTYFPGCRDFISAVRIPYFIAIWIASFSTLSLAHVLYRHRKENK